MNVLIVDNGSKYLERIVALVDMRHAYNVVSYDPDRSISDNGFDAIVLSGGMIHEVVDMLPDSTPYYRHELDLVRNSSKPILGICLGHQMTNVALGGTLREMDSLIYQHDMEILLNGAAESLFDAQTIRVHKRHKWVVDELSPELDVLAQSEQAIEILRHTSRPILTTQFHPEYDTSDSSLFWDVFNATIQVAELPRTAQVRSIEKYA